MNKQEKRDLVNRYLIDTLGRKIDSLIFSNSSGDPANLGIKKLLPTIDDRELIRIILRNKEEYYSRNQMTKKVETGPGKHRSVLDIWRHFKFYRDTSIFYVMSLIWEIREELRYQYCGMVERRVFDLEETYNLINRNTGSYHEDSNLSDEFNLKFIQWKELDIDSGEEDNIILEDEIDDDEDEDDDN